MKPEQTFRVELLRHLEQEIRFSGSGIEVDWNVADQDGDRDDQIRREKSVQIDSELKFTSVILTTVIYSCNLQLKFLQLSFYNCNFTICNFKRNFAIF